MATVKDSGWVRILDCASAHFHPQEDMALTIHGDDFMAAGADESLDKLDDVLAANICLNWLGRVGPGGRTSGNYLKRTIEWRDDSFICYSKESHMHARARLPNLENAKPADTPRSRDTGKAVGDAEDFLDADEVGTCVRVEKHDG